MWTQPPSSYPRVLSQKQTSSSQNKIQKNKSHKFTPLDLHIVETYSEGGQHTPSFNIIL